MHRGRRRLPQLEEPPRWSPQLYDLELDPYEQSDFSSVSPAETERLADVYNEWFADVGADIPSENETWHRWDRYGPVPIRIGGEGAERVVLTRQDWRRNDGDGWGQNGQWVVLFNDGGLFADRQDPWSVRVVLPPKTNPSRVQLGINSGVWTYVTWEGEIEEGQTEVLLEGVQNAWVPGQSSTVLCTLFGDERGKRGPHQLIFFR